MAGPELLRIEVVYALPQSQVLHALRLPAGACVRDAVEASGLLQAHPELQQRLALAVFGRLAEPVQRLNDGDRVELLRPLMADPKDQRRARVQAARKARLKN